MLILDIITWIAVGLALGGGWGYFGKRDGVTISSSLILGLIGGVVGGFAGYGFGPSGSYSITALITSVVGAIFFLFINAVRSFRPPRQQTPTGGPV